jgi:AAA family ATP:ADP antiporter
MLHGDAGAITAFNGRYAIWTGLVSMLVMIIGGNILRRFSWFTAAVITPAITLIAGSLFFAFILWRDSFTVALAAVGTTPLVLSVFIGAAILILAKSTKYALFDLTKEMAYIPLGEDMKVKGKVVVEVVGGRLGKGSGAFLQSTLLFVIGLFSKEAVKFTGIAGSLLTILILTCLLWILAVRALGKKIAAITSDSGRPV